MCAYDMVFVYIYYVMCVPKKLVNIRGLEYIHTFFNGYLNISNCVSYRAQNIKNTFS